MIRGELIQVDPAGPTLTFDWNPTTLVRSGRLARLTDVDRPRRTSAVEWAGTDPFTIEFTLRLDGYPDESVHDRLAVLEQMAGIHRPDEEPPRVRLRYSGFSQVRYVIAGLDQGPEVRRDDLAIVRVDIAVTLREWVVPDLVVTPARRAQQRVEAAPETSQTAGRTHTVVSGDTLWALAVKHLGSGPRWQEIADANGVRDPRLLQIGTVLRLPNR